MRRFGYMIMTVVMAVLMLGACQRRPFAENRTHLYIALKINTDIVNHTQHELPEYMRVDLYNPETAELVFTDYLGPEGGIIHPVPGIYDMIVYSIGSESTLIQNEHNYNTIEAYTNEISAQLKSQIAQFMAKRAKATKDPVPYTDEPVVNQPDHIFVGWYHELDIPVTYVDEPVREVYVEVDAHTLVETWQVEIRNVEGSELVTESLSLISGQRGSVHIGPNVASEKIVSVFFEMHLEDRQGGGKCLKGKFNSFGRHPDKAGDINIDLSVINRGGGEQIFHFDVTDKFDDNPQRYILIEDPITIIESSGGGGGFKPVVDDWEDINTDIDL